MTQEPDLFPYVVPQIYPVFSEACGRLVTGTSVKNILDHYAEFPLDGSITVRFERFEDGAAVGNETVEMAVAGGRVETPVLVREYNAATLGYVQISLSADRPLFRKINVEPGYGLLIRPDNGVVTVLIDEKFANPLIIKQIEATGRFCLLHVACLVDRPNGIGNSFLLVNPYGKDIVATLVSSKGRRLRKKVPSMTAALQSLEELCEDGVPETIMLTANNRLPVWDVRHRADDPACINDIDHLEVYRGYDTHERVGATTFLRALWRRQLMKRGLRIS